MNLTGVGRIATDSGGWSVDRTQRGRRNEHRWRRFGRRRRRPWHGGWRLTAVRVSILAMSDEAARSAADALRFLAEEFTLNRRLAERAVAQMPRADLGWLPDERSNSIAMLMKHVGGNLRSRFTDFLTSDGEKPTRDRDAEFRNDVVDHDAVLAQWNAGWECVAETLATLTPADLNREVTIRGESHTVLQALLRAVGHAAYHSGQIVELARMRSPQWTTLTRPRTSPP